MLFQRKQASADPETVEAVKRILHGGLALGGAGIVGRMGLEALSPTPAPKIPFVSPGPSNVPYTVPVTAEEEARRKKLQKTAGEPSLLDKILNHTATGIASIAPNTNAILGKPTNAASQAWMMPLQVGTGVGAAAGGYLLADKILDSRRKRLADQDVEEAQKDYADALNGASKVAHAVDQLAETMVKHAMTGADIANGANWAGGAWATGMIAAALGGGAIGYHMTAKGSQPRLLNKALRDRSKQMWNASGQPIHFVSTPAPAPPALKMATFRFPKIRLPSFKPPQSFSAKPPAAVAPAQKTVPSPPTPTATGPDGMPLGGLAGTEPVGPQQPSTDYMKYFTDNLPTVGGAGAGALLGSQLMGGDQGSANETPEERARRESSNRWSQMLGAGIGGVGGGLLANHFLGK